MMSYDIVTKFHSFNRRKCIQKKNTRKCIDAEHKLEHFDVGHKLTFTTERNNYNFFIDGKAIGNDCAPSIEFYIRLKEINLLNKMKVEVENHLKK